jgi:hypothetical protein
MADMIARSTAKPARSMGKLQALAIALALILAGVAIARADYSPVTLMAPGPESSG